MTESKYDPCLLFRSELLRIVKLQTNDILILANNNFTSIKEEEMKLAKIIIKNRKYLTFAHPLKFNSIQIKLDSNGIVLTKRSHVGGILLVTNHAADFTSSKEITRKKLLPKKLYLAQRVKGTYITFVYQSEASFNLF